MQDHRPEIETFFEDYARRSDEALQASDGRRGDIAFQNIYFLNFATGEPKIFAYITPDEEQAMRDHGLICAAE